MRFVSLFAGIGGMDLGLERAGMAAFGWNKFIDASGQQGINCSFFRNESPVLSSTLILAAEQHARQKWGGGNVCTPMSIRKPSTAVTLVTVFR